jgi:hypothetical protein
MAPICAVEIDLCNCNYPFLENFTTISFLNENEYQNLQNLQKFNN